MLKTEKGAGTFLKRCLPFCFINVKNAVAGQSRLSGTAYRVSEIAAFIPAHRAEHPGAFSSLTKEKIGSIIGTIVKLSGPAYRQAGTPLGRGRHAGASRQGNIILHCAP